MVDRVGIYVPLELTYDDGELHVLEQARVKS